MQREYAVTPAFPGNDEIASFCLARSNLELRGKRLFRTSRSGQMVEHQLASVSEMTFSVGNNLAVPGIGLVLLGAATLGFFVIPVPWIGWTVLIATTAFVSFAMFGMRTPLLTFVENGVRFRYPLIGPADEVAAFQLAIKRAMNTSDAQRRAVPRLSP